MKKRQPRIKRKTTRVPRTRAGGEWTEAGYWGFIRGTLRRGARNYPPIARLALERARRENQSDNKRLKWEFQCADCGCWFPRKEVRVDHVEPAGKLTCYDDLPGFVRRLYCELDNLQVLCIPCHDERPT